MQGTCRCSAPASGLERSTSPPHTASPLPISQVLSRASSAGEYLATPSACAACAPPMPAGVSLGNVQFIGARHSWSKQVASVSQQDVLSKYQPAPVFVTSPPRVQGHFISLYSPSYLHCFFLDHRPGCVCAPAPTLSLPWSASPSKKGQEKTEVAGVHRHSPWLFLFLPLPTYLKLT